MTRATTIKRRLAKAVATLAIALVAVPAFAADVDGDGLDSSLETEFGTLDTSADFDGDNLSDFDEVFVYGTDPTLADTDGDGTNDDVDSNPVLHSSSTPEGTSPASYTGASTTRPYAWSGESPQDGKGVYVHNGMLEYSTTAGWVYQLQGRWSFWLNYNSQSDWDGAVGHNWSSILDLHVTAAGASGEHWDMFMPNGHKYRWADNGGGWDPPNDGEVLGDLTEDSGFVLWTLPDGQVLTFDPNKDGKLISWEDRYSNALAIGYDVNNMAETITDTRGAVHDLGWYSSGRLEYIDYADGRRWTLKYDDDGNLQEILGPSSTHFVAGIAEEFRYTHGASTASMNHNLIRVIDGCGNSWMKVEYNTSDQVTKQTIGDGFYEFAYSASPLETTVSDRVGNDRVWTWDTTTLARSSLEQQSNRNVRTGDPASWDTSWTHDSEGYLLSVTLPEGNGTKYTLNGVKRPTEIRRKTNMAAADSASNDLIQTFTYETAGKHYAVATATDPEGNQTTYTNDANGRPTTITFETITNVTPNQTITNTRTYNSDGTLASVTDGEGKKTSYTYYTVTAKKGRVNTVKVDDGGLNLITTYDYTDFGVRDEVTDPESNTTSMVIDDYGIVTKVTPPTSLGYETILTYCGNLNLTSRSIKRVDENGTALTAPTHWTTQYSYDLLDNVTQVIEDIDASTTRTTTIDYDANENRTGVHRGAVSTTYTYDERDLLFEVSRSPGGATQYTSERTYTDNGNLETFENARGYVTTHTYDGFDRRITTTNALDHSTEWTYDKNGNVIEIERYEDNAPSADILIAHQKRHYDELNRLYEIEDVLQGSPDVWLSMTMEYDKRHLVIERTDRGGDSTTNGYDGAGRRTSTTDAEGNVTTLTLDDNGNVTKIEEQELNPGSTAQTFETQFTYDEINRRLTQKVIDRTNGTNFKLTQWEYDSLNVPIVTTDPMGYETTVEHDGLGRITQRSVDLGASAAIVTQWTYDQHDNVTVYTDDNGSDTTYAYDDMNRLETKTYEDTETVDFTYDAVGNVTQIIDQNGTDIDQEFDALNRLTGRSATLATGVIGDDDEWFAYDGLNRLTEAKDDDSIVQLTYDSLSRILTEKQGSNPFGSTAKTVSYTYDNSGNMTQIDYPSGFDAVRTYDDIHRLTGIDDGSSNNIVDFAYYGAGGRLKDVSFGNATTTTNTWDGFRRPTEISHEDSTPTEFAGFTYAWDKNDNPLYEERSHDSGAGDVYTYDQANRLKKVLTDVADPANEVANPGTETYTDKVEWTLDDVHNFTSVATTPYGGSASTVSYTVNSMNEYTAIGATSRTFDANGNLTDDGTYEFEYDFHNHLVEVTLKSSSTTIATYSYDALGRGRRWKKVVGSDTTRFIYHDQHVIEEYDGSDNLLRLFVFGQGWDNIVMMEAPDVADVDSDANTTELKRFYYHRQLKGDVTHITDEDEAVVESYEYTPYGEPTIKDIGGSTVSGSQIGNPFLYTGRRLDEETGLYYYRARHYDAESGRFIQRDPLEYVDGSNSRAYLADRPTHATDPTGTQEQPVQPGPVPTDFDTGPAQPNSDRDRDRILREPGSSSDGDKPGRRKRVTYEGPNSKMTAQMTASGYSVYFWVGGKRADDGTYIQYGWYQFVRIRIWWKGEPAGSSWKLDTGYVPDAGDGLTGTPVQTQGENGDSGATDSPGNRQGRIGSVYQAASSGAARMNENLTALGSSQQMPTNVSKYIVRYDFLTYLVDLTNNRVVSRWRWHFYVTIEDGKAPVVGGIGAK